MSWVEECPEAEMTTTTTKVTSLPIPIPPLPQPPALSKVYIRNLHADTSQDNLTEVLSMMTYAAIHRPFVSNLTKGKRWAKFDIEATAAEEAIARFNFIAGVLRAHAHAEYARS